MQQRIGNRYRADGVIGKVRLGMKQGLEVFRPVVVEFVHRSDDVTCDSAQHFSLRDDRMKTKLEH